VINTHRLGLPTIPTLISCAYHRVQEYELAVFRPAPTFEAVYGQLRNAIYTRAEQNRVQQFHRAPARRLNNIRRIEKYNSTPSREFWIVTGLIRIVKGRRQVLKRGLGGEATIPERLA